MSDNSFWAIKIAVIYELPFNAPPELVGVDELRNVIQLSFLLQP